MTHESTRPGLSPEALQALSKTLTDNGLLIEAGWTALRAAAIPKDAPALQLEEMRNSFFAGAQHLFSSIMTILDPGTEPTDADLGRMALIQDELNRFIRDYQLRRLPAEGSA